MSMQSILNLMMSSYDNAIAAVGDVDVVALSANAPDGISLQQPPCPM
jgi:hypothetical protein